MLISCEMSCMRHCILYHTLQTDKLLQWSQTAGLKPTLCNGFAKSLSVERLLLHRTMFCATFLVHGAVKQAAGNTAESNIV